MGPGPPIIRLEPNDKVIFAGERVGKEKQECLSPGRASEKVVGGFRHHREDQAGEGGDSGGGDPAEDERVEGEEVGEPRPAGPDAHQGEIDI